MHPATTQAHAGAGKGHGTAAGPRNEIVAACRSGVELPLLVVSKGQYETKPFVKAGLASTLDMPAAQTAHKAVNLRARMEEWRGLFMDMFLSFSAVFTR